MTGPIIALTIILAAALAPAASAPAVETTLETTVGAQPPLLEWKVISRRPHDVQAFTQGLLLDESGSLFESTGRYGHSTLRETDADSGSVDRSIELPDERFGEGLALVDDRLIQLSWRSGVATVFDAATFEPLETFAYAGEGWGLCYDGERLLMGDGSAALTVRDPDTFEVLDSIEVTLAGEPQRALNELECVDGRVWANVWHSDRIVRIDPASGVIDGVLDLAGIMQPHPADAIRGAVLNGIAWDPGAMTFLVTGKLWPELIEIRVSDDVGVP